MRKAWTRRSSSKPSKPRLRPHPAKKHGEDIDVRVSIDRRSGEYETFRRWMVFADESDELEEPLRELRLEDAVDVDAEAQPGEYVEVPLESMEFGRIAAQTAKQVIVQKVREAERKQVIEDYQDREGELVGGIVKRVDRNGAYVDLGGNAEGFLARGGPDSPGTHQGPRTASRGCCVKFGPSSADRNCS